MPGACGAEIHFAVGTRPDGTGGLQAGAQIPGHRLAEREVHLPLLFF